MPIATGMKSQHSQLADKSELLMRIELTTFPILSGWLYQFLKQLYLELLMRIELTTSSLPRKCSTPELQQLERSLSHYFKKLIFLCFQQQSMSGRPGSNRPPEAWKATALPNELLPLVLCSKGFKGSKGLKRFLTPETYVS